MKLSVKLSAKSLSKRNLLRTTLLTGCLLVGLTFFNNCQKVYYQQQQLKMENGTSVGNPLAPASKTALSAICSVINRCHPGVAVEQCLEGVGATGGFESSFGLSTPFADFAAIIAAEQVGTLRENAVATSSCYTQVNALDCANPLVQAAYDRTQANPFSATPAMIPPNSCDRIFTPAIDLEVPIEMVDNGLASKTTDTVFARTRTSLNPNDYDGTVTYSFEVVATNLGSSPRNVNLVNGAGGLVASLSVPANTTNPTRLRTSLTPTPSLDTYRLSLTSTSTAGQLTVFAGRMLVQQRGATRSKIYVPLTSQIANNASSADDFSAAIDRAGCCDAYVPNALWYRTLWRKNSAAFQQLSSGPAFTLEAVISTSGGASTATAALLNTSTGLPVAGSEVATNATAPTLVSASFANNAAQFADQRDFEFQVKNSGVGTEAYIYRSGLWISLSNLMHGEVYYRVAASEWEQNAFGGNLFDQGTVMLNTDLFTPPFSVFHDVTGFVTEPNTPCSVDLYDRGLLDAANNFDGTLVPGSNLSFTSLSRVTSRSSALSLTSGHRFVSKARANPATGSCLLLGPRIVVGF